MITQQINGTNIKTVKFDPMVNKLTVIFQDGSEWDYAGVPVRLFQAMIHADSPGSYFNSHIKPRYRGKKAAKL